MSSCERAIDIAGRSVTFEPIDREQFVDGKSVVAIARCKPKNRVLVTVSEAYGQEMQLAAVASIIQDLEALIKEREPVTCGEPLDARVIIRGETWKTGIFERVYVRDEKLFASRHAYVADHDSKTLALETQGLLINMAEAVVGIIRWVGESTARPAHYEELCDAAPSAACAPPDHGEIPPVMGFAVPKPRLVCTACGYKARYYGTMIRHLKRVHGASHEDACELALPAVCDPPTYPPILLSPSNPVLRICGFCGARFESVRVRRHFVCEHNIPDERFSEMLAEARKQLASRNEDR